MSEVSRADTDVRERVEEQPDILGEYCCSACGTPGFVCLNMINASPALAHCCGSCPFTADHSTPGAYWADEGDHDG